MPDRKTIDQYVDLLMGAHSRAEFRRILMAYRQDVLAEAPAVRPESEIMTADAHNRGMFQLAILGSLLILALIVIVALLGSRAYAEESAGGSSAVGTDARKSVSTSSGAPETQSLAEWKAHRADLLVLEKYLADVIANLRETKANVREAINRLEAERLRKECADLAALKDAHAAQTPHGLPPETPKNPAGELVLFDDYGPTIVKPKAQDTAKDGQ